MSALSLNRWLKGALVASNMKQAELARRLAEKNLIANDRSAVNKMVLGKRKISADELLAIAQITQFPPPLLPQAVPRSREAAE